MARNKMSDLRDHLFETLEQLKDKQEPLDLDRARVICQVGQTLIESAKVEVQFINAIGEGINSEFFGNTAEMERRRQLSDGDPKDASRWRIQRTV